MIKGETLRIEITAENATALEVRLGGPQARTVTASLTDGVWKATADTASWAVGLYAWQAWATYADSTKTVVETGTLPVTEPLAANQDVRSVAQKNVEAIEAMLTKNAPEGVRRYRINNRELERYSVAELLQLLSHWKAELRKETRLAKGRGPLGPRIAFRI